MNIENPNKGKSLSYFHRDLDSVKKLSDCVMSVHRETVVEEGLEIAHYLHKRILGMKPELSGLLSSMEELVEKRLARSQDPFTYDELLQLTLISKTFQCSILRRYLCAYKMLLTVAHSERFFVDAILIYYSAVFERKFGEGTDLEKNETVLSDLDKALSHVCDNLKRLDVELNLSEERTLPYYLSRRDRESESDYREKLEEMLIKTLDELSMKTRRHIRAQRYRALDMTPTEFKPTMTYGYKFRHSLYSNHASILKTPNKMIQNHPETSQQAYALYISFQVMDAFREYREIHDAMETSMELLKEHLDGKVTKREVSQSLIRVINIVDAMKLDVLCYQAETFVNAMESIMGKQITSRALRTDLSASLESNYHIESPRKTQEILEYHMDSMSYMDDAMKNYADLGELMDDLENGRPIVSDKEAPYRQDMTETDMDHLKSGAENVRKQYESYVLNTRSPKPLHADLKKDSIDASLSRRDDIRYGIYSIVPDEENVRLFRSMNFDIRDIF